MTIKEDEDLPLVCMRVDAGKQKDTDRQTDESNQAAVNMEPENSTAHAHVLTSLKERISRLFSCSKKQFRVMAIGAVLLVIGIAIGIGIGIPIGKAIATQTATLPVSPETTRETEQQPDEQDRKRTHVSPIFTFSICFNDAMQDVCKSSSLSKSSIHLICTLLTLSTSVDLLVASKGRNYEQLCKTFNKPGTKGMTYVCHTCLDYNSSDTITSDLNSVLRETECFFEPAINQHNYSYDGTSAFLALRSNDPVRWARSSHFWSTDMWKRSTGSQLFAQYLKNCSKVETMNLVQPICSKYKQCSDIVNLHVNIHAAEDGGPPDCSQEEQVRSWASDKECISTKDWLSGWLNCCP